MADDSTATPAGSEDPTPDTPAGDTGDTTGNTDTPPKPVDWQARYNALQPDYTRKATALSEAEERIAALEEQLSSNESDDEGDEEGDGEAQPQPKRPTVRESGDARYWRERAEAYAWQQAEAIHGPEVIAAYAAAATLYERAETPSDYVTAFEAYHQARLTGKSPAQAAAAPSAPTNGNLPSPAAVQPRVDQNRPDAAPEANDLDPTRYEGGANGGAVEFFKRQLEKVTGG